MKKITDERLILRNLHNIRIAYVVQTLGILSILGYNFFQGGFEEVRGNPLWVVFMLTMIAYLYLSMSVSIEHEKKIKNPRKLFLISLIGLISISVIFSYFISITPSSDTITGVLLGFVVFICGFIPLYYIYRLRIKQKQEFENE